MKILVDDFVHETRTLSKKHHQTKSVYEGNQNPCAVILEL